MPDTILGPTLTAVSPPLQALKRKAMCRLKKTIRAICSMFALVPSTPHAENFQRTVLLEIYVPDVGVRSAYVPAFFDRFTFFNYISEDCATQLGVMAYFDNAHLLPRARWHAKKDENLKEPRLHFNSKLEDGNFLYARDLGQFGIVIGWETIQALGLLEPRSGIAAAAFCQMPPSVDRKLSTSRSDTSSY